MKVVHCGVKNDYYAPARGLGICNFLNSALERKSHKILSSQNFLKPSGFSISATGKLSFSRPLSCSISLEG